MKLPIFDRDLEKESLKELWNHCPLCGTRSKTNKCEMCGFKWKKEYIYFSNEGNIADWKRGNDYIDMEQKNV